MENTTVMWERMNGWVKYRMQKGWAGWEMAEAAKQRFTQTALASIVLSPCPHKRACGSRQRLRSAPQAGG